MISEGRMGVISVQVIRGRAGGLVSSGTSGDRYEDGNHQHITLNSSS